MSPFALTHLEAAFPLVDRIFHRYAVETPVPGLAYGIVAGGALVHTGCFGVRDVAIGAPVEPGTVFRIASMTKSFTALAMVMLRDAGKLDLDDPVTAYVPELAGLSYPTPDSAPVTIRHLLTMSAGWPQDDPWADRQLGRADAELRTLLRQGVPFSNLPGVAYEYSNYGYMVLGRVISAAAGMTYLTFVDERILRPLGMTRTHWNDTEVLPEALARGYRRQGNGWLEEPMLASRGDAASFGGLFSSVNDLARWVSFFMEAWEPAEAAEDRILCRSSRQEMQQVWRQGELNVEQPALGAPPRAAVSGYGYGLSPQQLPGYRSVGHSGGLPGFGSHMRWLPDHGIGIVALANATYAPMRLASQEALELLVRGGHVRTRAIEPAPALTAARADVVRLSERWDDRRADRLFAENFFLDESRAHWQQQFDMLHERLGPLKPDGDLVAENALRGRWRMAGERGWCDVWISLAPTLPPRVQEMELTPVVLPCAALQTAASRLAALTQRPSRRAFDRLFAATADRDAIYDQLRIAAILCGPCVVGEIVAGDGERQATFRLQGSKAAVDVSLTYDPAGRFTGAVFRMTGDG
jgi:CubicO group peptidase (beta-lactamase class C family)